MQTLLQLGKFSINGNACSLSLTFLKHFLLIIDAIPRKILIEGIVFYKKIVVIFSYVSTLILCMIQTKIKNTD